MSLIFSIAAPFPLGRATFLLIDKINIKLFLYTERFTQNRSFFLLMLVKSHYGYHCFNLIRRRFTQLRLISVLSSFFFSLFLFWPIHSRLSSVGESPARWYNERALYTVLPRALVYENCFICRSSYFKSISGVFRCDKAYFLAANARCRLAAINFISTILNVHRKNVSMKNPSSILIHSCYSDSSFNFSFCVNKSNYNTSHWSKISFSIRRRRSNSLSTLILIFWTAGSIYAHPSRIWNNFSCYYSWMRKRRNVWRYWNNAIIDH